MTTRPSIPFLILTFFVLGCQSAPAPPPATSPNTTPAITYPARPTTPPAHFRVVHHANSSFTLVVPETSTDDQLTALVWQLRDAALTHSFGKLHISQKQVDSDGSTIWFHIYRSSKCAPEKYVFGKLPCGDSYHAAADYTLSPHTAPLWNAGVLIHGDDHETQLWNPDAPYTPSTSPGPS